MFDLGVAQIGGEFAEVIERTHHRTLPGGAQFFHQPQEFTGRHAV